MTEKLVAPPKPQETRYLQMRQIAVGPSSSRIYGVDTFGNVYHYVGLSHGWEPLNMHVYSGVK